MDSPHQPVPHALSRRSVFRLGASAATAVGAAGLGSSILTPGAARAALPASAMFQIGAHPYEYFGPKLLHETHHAMQGMTFDDVNGRMFIVQGQNGGGDNDLVVNQVNGSGDVLASMVVANAGHGVSIAAEPVGDVTYIWIECDADGSTDRGTALARVQFKEITRTSIAASAKFFTGSNSITAAVDPENQRLLVRRKEGGEWWLSVWPLSKARAGLAADRLVHVRQPIVDDTFQGYTFYGQYAYFLYGNGHADASDIDSKLAVVDLNTGAFVRTPTLFTAGESINYREPEGMAVHRMSNGDLGLFFGFASRPGDGGLNRYANVFYKKL